MYRLMPQRKSDVVFVSKNLRSIGGVQTVVNQIAMLLNEAGTNASTYSFGDHSRHSTVLSVAIDMWRLFILHLTGAGTFVYTITGYQVILFSFISKIFKRNVIYWEHGNPLFLERALSYKLTRKYLYKSSKSIIVTHRAFALSKDLPYLYIPNPYQIEKSALARGERNEIDKVVWVGRFSDEKQPDLALSAMISSAQRNSEVDFFFIHVPFKRSLAITGSNIHIIDGKNYVPSALLDQKSLLLLTSTAEAMPGVIFEAISNLSAIMSTKCTPWIEDINGVTTTFIIDKDVSPDDLSIKIDRALKAKNIINHELLSKVCNEVDGSNVQKKWISLLVQ